jgi:hypothetical protein
LAALEKRIDTVVLCEHLRRRQESVAGDDSERKPEQMGLDAMEPNTPDAQSLHVWFVLVILGLILSLVGWYRWAT